MSANVDQAAQRLREALHVAREVGGRAAQAELTQARAAVKQAAGLTRTKA